MIVIKTLKNFESYDLELAIQTYFDKNVKKKFESHVIELLFQTFFDKIFKNKFESCLLKEE